MDASKNFVITGTDQATYRTTATLLNFLHQTQKLAIGQCITSQIFEMKCPKIGKSRWMLIVFPAGQYEFERDNGQLSVYLKMMGCEFENEKLLVDVTFFIDSEEKLSKIVPTTTLHYKNNRARWVGTNLVNKSEFQMQVNCDHLMQDNNLVIGCRMIHSASINDIDPKQTETYGNSLKIDVPRHSPPSSIICTHINGTEWSPKSSAATFPSTIISESKQRQSRIN